MLELRREASESLEDSVALLPQVQQLRVGFYLFYRKKTMPYSGYFSGKLVKPRRWCTIISELQQQIST